MSLRIGRADGLWRTLRALQQTTSDARRTSSEIVFTEKSLRMSFRLLAWTKVNAVRRYSSRRTPSVYAFPLIMRAQPPVTRSISKFSRAVSLKMFVGSWFCSQISEGFNYVWIELITCLKRSLAKIITHWNHKVKSSRVAWTKWDLFKRWIAGVDFRCP